MGICAIFGGTFNPLHIGHYEMLSALQNDDTIDKILILPDKIPPHKNCEFLTDDQLRIKMCELAAQDFSKAEVNLIEFERQGKSYTYDTVVLLKERFPDFNFSFVCGGDMLVYFPKWYRWEELLRELPFIVFKRSDTDLLEFETSVKYLSELGMKIIVKDEIIPSVSSTQIRNDLKLSKNLLPEKIYNLLLERGICIE